MDEIRQYAEERLRMVDSQILRRGIREPRLLEALREIPRHLFVPEEERERAYLDGPLPIGLGQTISQPYIVAVMTLLLEISAEDTVLEIGTGSGYQAAVLARLAGTVHSVERHAALAQKARGNLSGLDVKNVYIHVGDGSCGWPENAPYRGILVTAAAPSVPPALLEQLSDKGRLVIPVGGHHGQYLQRWQRLGERFEQETFFPVAFVPLRGEAGWQEKDWDGITEWL